MKWQKEIYNSIMVQHRPSLRRQTRVSGFTQFYSVSDSQKQQTLRYSSMSLQTNTKNYLDAVAGRKRFPLF